MVKKLPLAPSDLRGMARLAVEATTGMADLVEAMHDSIGHPLEPWQRSRPATSRGVKGLIYETIRTLARTLGSGVDAALSPFESLQGAPPASPDREALLAVLNGVVGDHLAATGNPMAIPMSLRVRNGDQSIDVDLSDSAALIPEPGPRLLVLVHGLCRNERLWTQSGHDHGAELAADLGFTPLYLRYNSGLHISTNGKALADLLESLLSRWPRPGASLTLLAHSMGGLLAHSACHHAATNRQAWLGALRHLIFLGTPHHGAPLERGGHWIDQILEASPFAGPLARLGKIRSAGITDLRHGNLLDEDWQDPENPRKGKDTRIPVPLPQGVRCCAMAATTGQNTGSLKDRLIGDGLVPVDSALGRHRDPRRRLGFPEECTWVGTGMNHLELLARPRVYEQIKNWLADPPVAAHPS
jgi:hypothetical protein